MKNNREEIHQVLERGLEILAERPELWNHAIDQIIDELDDGTEQMISDRWGVAAHVIIHHIDDFQPTALVACLDRLYTEDCGCLAFEYAGFLLQRDHGVALESLLVEAHRQHCFERIFPFVCPSLRYMPAVSMEWTLPVLEFLEQYPAKRDQILLNYAKGIAACGAFSRVIGLLEELQSQTQADFTYQVFREWFKIDPDSGLAALRVLAGRNSFWSKCAYLDVVNYGQGFTPEFFSEQFNRLQQLFEENIEFRKKVIAIFVHALIAHVAKEPIYSQILTYLRKIPVGLTEDRCAYLSAICWQNELSELLTQVLIEILKVPFEEGKCPLGHLNTVLYYYGHQYGWKEMLVQMRTVFCANGYRSNSDAFFQGLSQTEEILHENTQEVTEEALKDMASSEVDRVFFGVGLLTNVFQGDCVVVPTEVPKLLYTDAQLTQILKALMYLSVDEVKACHGAFQLLTLSPEEPKQFLTACWDDIYENYPHTLYESAKNYRDATNGLQKQLAEQVIAVYEAELRKLECSYAIRDLCASQEERYLYAQAQNRQSNNIRRLADEKSVLARLFTRRVLKYGRANAHIIKGGKNTRFFQAAPYQTLEYSKELPALYINDPVEFWARRNKLLQEVTVNAVDSEGLSAATEGEG